MRVGSLLLVCLAACNTQVVDSAESPPASVRERLSEDGARMLWNAGDSAGTITVQRRLGGGAWEAGLVDLKIDQGEVVASADPVTGTITIERLTFQLEDIAIPESVFNREAALSKVRAQLRAPAIVETVWSSDDAAHLTASLDFVLSWALTVNGSTADLGAPDFPPFQLQIDVTGDGADVHVDVDAGASGELWSWAGLLKLEDLHLVLSGATP